MKKEFVKGNLLIFKGYGLAPMYIALFFLLGCMVSCTSDQKEAINGDQQLMGAWLIVLVHMLHLVASLTHRIDMVIKIRPLAHNSAQRDYVKTLHETKSIKYVPPYLGSYIRLGI